ncbi:MAG: metallophosphoesterase [Deltaproteobacteria bacterium]|nr:metallophosphoesterase [Deltaproteobacteria bacterium]
MSPVRILVFLCVVLTLTYGSHYYLWSHLVRDVDLGSPLSKLATGLLIALAATMPIAMILVRVVSRRTIEPLAWVAFVWMGTLFLLLLSTAGVDLVRRMISLVAGDSLASPERRLTLARASASAALVLGGGLSVRALLSARVRDAVRTVRVSLSKFPETMAGYRIAQLTDVHIGPTLDRTFMEAVVRATNARNPHLVVITGDLVDGSVAQLAEHVRPLADLRARDGVFFVTGNHEYYSGADEWIAFLQTLGIRVLRNERVRITAPDSTDSFELAGVDDASAHQFGNGHGADYRRALSDRDPSCPVILLAHQPRQILAAQTFAPDLVLSGHTHGGQIAPIHWLVKLQQPYVAGLHQHSAQTQIYVSRGTGYWGPPMRLAAPSEIALIELHPA